MKALNNTTTQNTNTELPVTKKAGERETGMFVTVAAQGTGKTYQNMIIIGRSIKYITDFHNQGRKVLILDTNGEYTAEQFAKNGHPNFPVKILAVKDIKSWCRSNLIECRRIDMKSLHVDDKIKILEYCMPIMRTCVFVMEDINTITTDMNKMGNVVNGIVNLRHKAVDVIVSYQSLRAVEPRIFSNSRWLRLHYAVGDVIDVKGKLDNPELFKIAQIIINNRYFNGDERFFLYIYNNPPKLKGEFTKEEFMDACKKFLMIKKNRIKQHMEMYNKDHTVAVDDLCNQYYKLFYGNDDKKI